MTHTVFRKHMQKYFMATTALTVASMLSTTAVRAEPGQYETPTGFSLQSGSVNNPVLSGANDRNMDIQQNSNRAVINWNTFNIGRDASVKFDQTQGAGSVVINRVTNNTINRSEILGTLKANGTVMILDKNGVLFGKDSTIDVGGIIASTGELDGANQQAFMDNEAFNLTNTDANPNGRITNESGKLNVGFGTAKENGLMAFIAPYVENNGTINAKLGQVTLAAGKKVTVDFAGDELIQLAVNEKLAGALVDNKGTINAQGGTVTMTANAASSVVDTVVNMRGVVNATSYSAHNGKIVLSSKGGGKVVVDGTLDVSRGALEGGGTSAGTIEISGNDVVLTSAAKLLANLVATQVPVYKVIETITGYTYNGITRATKAELLALYPNSGSIAQRLTNATHRSAIEAGFLSLLGNITTTVAAVKTSTTTSEIDHYDSVDGSGNGGTVNINASNRLSFNSGALIDLRAGAVSGNGGSASLIAGFAVSYFGTVNAGAAHGTRGSLLIDPVVLVVSNAASGDIINTGALNSTLGTTNVTLLASEQVKFLESADFSGAAGHLTLNAPRLSFLGDFTTRTGGFSVVGGSTIDLGGKLYRKGIDTIFFPVMLTEADLADTATTVNILGNGASILQGQSLAQNGATINVAAGNYSELLNFEIYKSLSLFGTDATLTGSILSPNATVKVSADDVTIDGFSIAGTTLNGVAATGVDNLTLSNNSFTGFLAGSAVNLSGVTNSTLEKNNITLALSGITITGGNHISLLTNTILGANNGIVMSGSEYATLTGNTVTGALTDGINLSGANHSTLSGNIITGAGNDGIEIRDTKDLQMTLNAVIGAGQHGINLNTVEDTDLFLNAAGGTTGDALHIEHGKDVNIALNAFGLNTGHGIFASDLQGANIGLNLIGGTGKDGIHVDGGKDLLIGANAIIGTGENGITVKNATNATVILNAIVDAGNDGIYIDPTTGIATLNYITGAGGNGINVEDSADFAVVGNYITGSGANGIRISGSDRALTALNFVQDSANNGILVEGSSDNLITLNYVDGTTLGDGVHVSGGTNNTVALNKIDSAGDDGIQLEGTTGAILGNFIDGTGKTGVRIHNSDNTVTSLNSITNTGSDGVVIGASTNSSVVGNYVAHTGRAGINLEGGTSNLIALNHVEDTKKDGIVLINGQGTIIGNEVESAGTNGIRIGKNTDTLVTLNHVNGTKEDGIAVVGGSQNTVALNHVESAAGNGIGLYNTGLNTIAGNKIENTVANGIALHNSGLNLITLNHVTGKTGGDGIAVYGGALNAVALNHIEDVNGNGIALYASGLNAILGNKVENSNANGIGLFSSSMNLVSLNHVDGTTNADGIAVYGGTLNALALNHVQGAAGNGIGLYGTSFSAVLGNNVEFSGANGIGLYGSTAILTTLNRVADSNDNGIALFGSSLNTVALNHVDGTSYGDGIALNGGLLNNVALNHVEDAAGNGIANYGSNLTAILGNKVERSGKNGILVVDADGVLTAFNKVEKSAFDGIRIESGDANLIALNDVSASGGNGISLFGSTLSGIVGNKVDGSAASGVYVSGSNGTLTALNHVTNSGLHGIALADGAFNLITKNHVDGTLDGDGISVSGGVLNTVSFNKVENAGQNGIALRDTALSAILGNRVYDSGANGVLVSGSDGILTTLNHVENSNGDGIHVTGSSYNLVTLNHVDGTVNGDGIDINGGSKNAVVLNKVEGAAAHGINVQDSNSILIALNKVLGAGNDGIHANNAADVLIHGNRVNGVGDNGIAAHSVSGLTVTKNTVTGGEGGDNGIWVTDSYAAQIGGNTIDNFYNGIRTEFSEAATIANNILSYIWNDGVQVYEGNGTQITDNDVSFFGGDGIQVAYSNDILIDDNHIDGIGLYGGSEGESTNQSTGIRIGDNEFAVKKVYFGFGDFSGGDNIHITNNDVKNTGTGLSATAFNNGYINIAGNTFTDNTIGMHIGSGLIDLTGATNTFVGGNTAMLFERSTALPYFFPLIQEGEGGEYPQPELQYAELALVNDTLGTTVFKGQSQYYVDLRNGAFYAPGLPTIINGMDANWDGVPGGLMTADQLKAIEAKINDYDDDKSLGQIFAGFTLADLDDNQILKRILANGYKSGKAGITVRNTPFNTATTGDNNSNRFFSIQDLANLEPAAGGDDNQPTAAALAQLEPAAGDNDGQCWSNVGGGGNVNIDLSGDENVMLTAKTNCGGDI